MIVPSSTLRGNIVPAGVPALVTRPFITRCGLKWNETISSGKISSQKIFGVIGQDSAGSHQMGSFVHAARAGEQSVVTQEEEATQVEESLVLNVFPGQAHPLGVSEVEGGINFAIFSQNATTITLCLVLQERGINNELSRGMIELSLDPQVNKTGEIWHICIEDLPHSNVLYCYRVNGPRDWNQGHRFDYGNLLLDPYAKLIDGRRLFGDVNNKMTQFFGTYDFDSSAFDWGEDYKVPNLPEDDLVIYEMNVRAFTADESSGLGSDIHGSYLGVIEKIPHLLELGINAVELLPVFEFDELEFQRRLNPRDHMLVMQELPLIISSPYLAIWLARGTADLPRILPKLRIGVYVSLYLKKGEHIPFVLINTWGYSTINFFAPMSRYASNGGGPVNASREFKEMVKALHNAGIEVILDVVYNHTNEVDDENPYTTSFRGIDNKVYYMLDNNAKFLNFSGCGNTLNCNHPVVKELILDSLRHWVVEYHVDGFRFDLASVLCRGTDGSPLNAPPIIRAIAKDSVLSRCKLIAEPWDCGGLYLVGKFPNWDRWAEWNGIYRDDVRRFIKGDGGMKGSFATRISGSADLYRVNKRKPCHSINFVIAHDGFTLYDLVSYNFKHNDANGEGGKDGCSDNFSWNCGCEGETTDANIKALRLRQMKNFHVALLVSQGTPMMLMGDEYGHTRLGNNNSYGHDNALNHFQWGQLKEKKENIFRFLSEMIKFRRNHHVFTRENFIGKNEVTWHEDNWENSASKFLAFTLHEEKGGDIYIAFNAHDYFVKAVLPSPPRSRQWFRVVDTNLESPKDIVPEGVAGIKDTYNMAPYSSIIVEAKP